MDAPQVSKLELLERYMSGGKKKKKVKTSHSDPVSTSASVPSHAASVEKIEAGDERLTASGMKAGLRTADEVKRELDAKMALERSRQAALTAEQSGRHAQTVYRDKSGKKVAVEEAIRLAQPVKKPEPKNEWGKGVLQEKAALARAQLLEDEKEAPLANYADNAERDAELRERDRWGDPMLALVKKSRARTAEDLDDAPTSTAGAPSAPPTSAAPTSRKRYQGYAPPNRFNILPGSRWDGLDRSNGFEKKWFESQASKQARKEIAYKWSTEDM